jgi:hypothetical protein
MDRIDDGDSGVVVGRNVQLAFGRKPEQPVRFPVDRQACSHHTAGGIDNQKVAAFAVPDVQLAARRVRA